MDVVALSGRGPPNLQKGTPLEGMPLHLLAPLGMMEPPGGTEVSTFASWGPCRGIHICSVSPGVAQTVLIFYFLKRYTLTFGPVLYDIEEFLLIVVNFVKCDHGIMNKKVALL